MKNNIVIWCTAGLNKLNTIKGKREAYTKNTISTHNWRLSKELAVINETANSQNML